LSLPWKYHYHWPVSLPFPIYLLSSPLSFVTCQFVS
jgi:hypothetical protein